MNNDRVCVVVIWGVRVVARMQHCWFEGNAPSGLVWLILHLKPYLEKSDSIHVKDGHMHLCEWLEQNIIQTTSCIDRLKRLPLREERVQVAHSSMTFSKCLFSTTVRSIKLSSEGEDHHIYTRCLLSNTVFTCATPCFSLAPKKSLFCLWVAVLHTHLLKR